MKNTIFNKELGETITFLKTSSETGGTFTAMEISLGPRGGNPLHFHRSYTELFTAVQGRLGMELSGGKEILLNPGESYLVQKGEIHRFFNPDEGEITFTNRVEPGSTGLEDTLRILCGLAADGHYASSKIPRNLFHLAICGKMSDMRLSGWKGAMINPSIYILSWIAERCGIKKMLLQRYCYSNFII